MFLSVCLLIGWVVFSIVGDFHLKKAANQHFWIISPSFIYGLIIYASCSILAVISFKRMEFGTLAIVWSALSLAISVLSSVVVFDEPLTIRRSIALFLVLLATFVMRKEL